MELTITLLFWVHMLSLGLGGAAVFGIPVVGARMASATAETRPLLFAIAKRLSTIGRAALVLLLITGPLMFWLDFGWTAPNAWFWVKMALVALLLVVVILAGINAGRAEKGDREAAARAPMFGMAGMVTFALVLLAAALAFS